MQIGDSYLHCFFFRPFVVNRAKTMDRSRYGTSTWMDEGKEACCGWEIRKLMLDFALLDGEKSHSASTRHYRAPPSHALGKMLCFTIRQ